MYSSMELGGLKTRKKILVIATIAILVLAVFAVPGSVLTTYAADDEEEKEDKDDKEKEDRSEKEEKSDAEKKVKMTASGSKVEMEVKGDKIELEIEVEDTDMPDGSYEIRLDCDTRPEGQDNPILSGTLIIKDSKGEIELEVTPTLGKYDGCTLTFGELVQSVSSFTITSKESEEDDEEEEEQREKARHEAKEIAKEAKEDAKAKGEEELAKNIGKAEKFFGKSSKAVVSLKISLESDDLESISFGSAQLVLLKVGERQPMLKAVVNVLTDQPVDALTACLNGENIGELDLVPASDEFELTMGHLKKTLEESSITIPGIEVSVVQGTDCGAVPVLTGGI